MEVLLYRFCLFVLVCFGASLAKAEPLTLVLDWYKNPNHGPILIAQSEGFFAEEGLEVLVVEPTDPALPPRLAAAGKADVALTYQPQLHLEVRQDVPIRRVGTLIATPLNCLMTLKDGPVQSIEDLEGRKVGYSVANVEEAILTVLLEARGLSLDAITMVNVNWSLAPSLLSGQVDAVIGAYRNVEMQQLADLGSEGRCFYIEEEGFPPYDELIYVVHEDRVQEPWVADFLRALEKATQFIVNRPEESWQIIASGDDNLDNAFNAEVWRQTFARFALRPSALDDRRYLETEAFLQAQGLVDDQLPVSSLAVDVTRAD